MYWGPSSPVPVSEAGAAASPLWVASTAPEASEAKTVASGVGLLASSLSASTPASLGPAATPAIARTQAARTLYLDGCLEGVGGMFT